MVRIALLGTTVIRKQIKESISVKEALLASDELVGAIEKIVTMLSECFKSGSKLLIAGNGGSAAHAQHFAAELVGKYDKRERKALPAIALTTDTSILTAWSNDYEFDTVFERQVEALANEGDVLVVLSTSGNSPNLIKAVELAKEKGVKTIALLGKGGGKVKGMTDVELIVPSNETPRIQEVHTLLVHVITEEVERGLVEENE